MVKYSENDFMNLLSDKNKIVDGKKNISNVELNTSVKIENLRLQEGITYIFYNCVFTNTIIFKDIETTQRFEFRNCQFNSNLQFSNFRSSYSIDYLQCLVFINCSINWFDIGDKSVLGNGLFFNNTEIKTLQIQSLEITSGGIQIYKCNILRHLYIGNVKIKNGNLDIADETRINSISILNNITLHHIRLDFLSLKNSFINNLSCHSFICSIISEKSVEIRGIKCDVFSISDTKLEEKLIININHRFNKSFEGIEEFNGKLGSLDTSSSVIRQGFTLEGFNKYIKSICFKDLGNLNGSVSISNVNIDSLNLGGINQSMIVLNSIKIKNLIFDGFINKSTLYLKKITPLDTSSTISINSTMLGDTYFSDVDFNKFKPIEINKVDFSQVNQFVHCIEEQNVSIVSDDKNKQFRETFRQLKHASEKQGNRIKALEYQALEMKYFKKELKTNPESKFVDKAILLTGSTNDFGQNFVKALFIFFILSIYLYINILLSLSPSLKIQIVHEKSTFSMHIGKYIQLLNPTSSLKAVFGGSISFSGLTHFLHLIFKITLAFFTFQIVSAFRKYVKS